MNNLSELAGVELPLEPSWWPLPFAFWVTLTLALTLVLFWLTVTYYRSRYTREALNQLRALQAKRNLYQLDTLLRRLALTHHPRGEVANLSGNDWMDWLDQTMPEKRFSPLSHQWQEALYGNTTINEQQWQAYVEAAHAWILATGKQNKA